MRVLHFPPMGARSCGHCRKVATVTHAGGDFWVNLDRVTTVFDFISENTSG